MDRRGFFRALAGLGAVTAAAPLLPKAAEHVPFHYAVSGYMDAPTYTMSTSANAITITTTIHRGSNFHTFDGRIS